MDLDALNVDTSMKELSEIQRLQALFEKYYSCMLSFTMNIQMYKKERWDFV